MIDNSQLPYTNQLDTIEIVFKITSRCNLDCTYCYYFNGMNPSAHNLPAVISKENIKNVVCFIKEGVDELGLKKVNFDFHGGEPLLMNKSRFEWMCKYINDELKSFVEFDFTLQTNAIAIDDEWIDLFEKYNISIGVSLDGPKEYNDINRIDLKGHGSYKRTRDGIQKLTAAWKSGRIKSVGALCVINPNHKAEKIYSHFINTLGLEGMDFLLPDFTYDDYEPDIGYAEFLRDMFRAWIKFGYNKYEIRTINNLLNRLSGNTQQFFSSFSAEEATMTSFSIQTDGTLGLDDTFFSTPMWDKVENVHVSNTTLKEFLSHPVISKLDHESRTPPKSCNECCWVNICGGGGLLSHRYSSKSDNCANPSIHCNALKELYSEASAFLLNNGMDPEALKKVLFSEYELNSVTK